MRRVAGFLSSSLVGGWKVVAYVLALRAVAKPYRSRRVYVADQ
ncbi:hypothetical protein [Caulobacter sp.]